MCKWSPMCINHSHTHRTPTISSQAVDTSDLSIFTFPPVFYIHLPLVSKNMEKCFSLFSSFYHWLILFSKGVCPTVRKAAGLNSYEETEDKAKNKLGNRTQWTPWYYIKELEFISLIPEPRVTSKICSSHKIIIFLLQLNQLCTPASY